MVDYDATLQKFFAENIKYLEKLRARAKDKVHADRVTAAIDIVKRVAANPSKFANYTARVKEGLESADIAMSFIPQGSQDNKVYLTYNAVLNSMGDLKSSFEYRREQAQQELLKALKVIKYKNSSSLLKDFIFPFKSPAHFAVRSNKQYQI